MSRKSIPARPFMFEGSPIQIAHEAIASWAKGITGVLITDIDKVQIAHGEVRETVVSETLVRALIDAHKTPSTMRDALAAAVTVASVFDGKDHLHVTYSDGTSKRVTDPEEMRHMRANKVRYHAWSAASSRYDKA